MEAEAHIKVRAAFINMAVGAVLSSFTTLFHKIWANFQIMTKVTLVSVATGSHGLELVAGFDFAFVVRVGAVV